MKTITFEDIPQVLGEVYQMVAEMKEQRTHPVPEEDRLMIMTEYQDYIERRMGKRPARQTVYGQVFNRLVPFEKHGKFLYFRKSDIDNWLAKGRQV